MNKIIDLHCDLLSYLESDPSEEDPKRRGDDPKIPCSYPKLKEGGVGLQIAAIFTETGPLSAKSGERQAALFTRLMEGKEGRFALFQGKFTEEVCLLPAFENASGFSEEGEPLEKSFSRFERLCKKVGKPLYVSLTWNGENRFGGGCGSAVGLKEDGRQLLRFLNGRGIAIDLSHASDALARDILHCIDRENLKLSVMASHSNFREVMGALRNLPDEIASEIIRRKGLIGLVLFRPFVHLEDPLHILRHIEHGMHLGGSAALAFGADFFHAEDFTHHQFLQDMGGPCFFPEYGDSSKMAHLVALIQKELNLSQIQVNGLAFRNALDFIKRLS